MTQRSAPGRAPASAVTSLSFEEIPGQSRLFLDYLRDPAALRKFYPNAVTSPRDAAGLREAVLRSYPTDRNALCDGLIEINTAGGAGDATLKNIELLRKSDTVAVVTGQQAGLFTGPLYTIYKALSAIRLAEELRNSGTAAVPVFWVASEDHDLDEIDHADFVDDGLIRVTYAPAAFTESVSVGDIRFDEGVKDAVDALLLELPRTDLSREIRDLLTSAYTPAETYGTAFTKLILALLGKFGLIVIDPLNVRVKRLASPIYVAAVEHADEIVAAITARNKELESAAYSPQVMVEEDYFPLFWHDEKGRRLALRHTGDGMYRVKGEKLQLHRDELLRFAREGPHRLSPGVMLRPVVQDYLLPTLSYFGGSAEIAYFAQNSEVYRILDRPVTPIFHRQSFTIVQPRERRNLGRLGWTLKDLFKGKEAAILDAAERTLSSDLATLFADVEERINVELNRLGQRLSDADPTIAASLAARRKKILYHIETLRDKTLRSEVRKDETTRRRVDNIFNELLPNGVLQERQINVVTFLNKYGLSFIDWVCDAIDLSDNGHRILDIQ